MKSRRFPAARRVAVGWLAVLAVAALMIASITSADEQAAGIGEEVLTNGSFEGGDEAWARQRALVTIGAPAQVGSSAAHLRNDGGRTRGQFFQDGLILTPNTPYRLTFWARSPGGHDVHVALVQGIAPFTNYGLGKTLNVTPEWRLFTINFVTRPIITEVSDGRLRFRMTSGTRVELDLDAVSLVATGDPRPTATPSPSATSALETATATATATDTPPSDATATATATATPIEESTATATATATPINTDTATPTHTPTATYTPTATATNTPTATSAAATATRPQERISGTATPLPALGDADEMLVFNWDRTVIIGDSGFAQDKPVRATANGDM